MDYGNFTTKQISNKKSAWPGRNGKSLSGKLAIAIQITRAIEVLNSIGIIHRDIKPSNIMIEENSKKVKLLDLGLGKSSNKEMKKLTAMFFL